jgi:DNA-binding transcriptional ArsR family regulator
MSINSPGLDYELADRLVVSTPAELRAMADPLRATICDLLLERAATVTELAQAVRRPKGTVAHHVGVLVSAGLLKVVRTRRVRAVHERFYGRTARVFVVGPISVPAVEGSPVLRNDLAVAAAESAPAFTADRVQSILRHARIPTDRAAEFWERVEPLIHDFSRLPRTGNTVYAFVAALYPTDYPRLPDPTCE